MVEKLAREFYTDSCMVLLSKKEKKRGTPEYDIPMDNVLVSQKLLNE